MGCVPSKAPVRAPTSPHSKERKPLKLVIDAPQRRGADLIVQSPSASSRSSIKRQSTGSVQSPVSSISPSSSHTRGRRLTSPTPRSPARVSPHNITRRRTIIDTATDAISSLTPRVLHGTPSNGGVSPARYFAGFFAQSLDHEPDPSALSSGLFATHSTMPPRACTAKLCLESLTQQVLTPLSPTAHSAVQTPDSSASSRKRTPSPAGGGGNSPPLSQTPAGMEGAPLRDPVVREALKVSALFGGLTDAELGEIALAMSPLRCTAGQALLLAGEPNDTFFVVASGVFAQYEHHRRRTGPSPIDQSGSAAAAAAGASAAATPTAGGGSQLLQVPGQPRTGSAFSRSSGDTTGTGSAAAAAAAAAKGSRGSLGFGAGTGSRGSIAGVAAAVAAMAGGAFGSTSGGGAGFYNSSSSGSAALAEDGVRGGMSQVLCGRGACWGELSMLLAGCLSSKSVVCALDSSVAWAITRVRLRQVMARLGLRERAGVLSALGGVPLLHQLTKEQLRKLADRVEVLSFAEESQVLSPDESSPALYVIKEGMARVKRLRGAPPHQQTVTELLQTRQYFGEMALVTGDTTGLDVKARTALQVYRVRRPHLEALLGPVDTSLERASHLRCLSTIPLLRNMSSGELLRLLNLFQTRAYSCGDTILQQGEAAVRVHILISGTVAVVSQDPDTGQHHDVTLVSPVDYFGERALLEADARNASVLVRSARAVCLELERSAFNSAFGPVRHVMERQSIAQSPMLHKGGDLRPVALLKDGDFGRVALVDLAAAGSPRSATAAAGHSHSTRIFSFDNPMYGPSTRRIVRSVPGERGECCRAAQLAAGAHAFVVHLQGWFVEGPTTSLVLEHLEGGSLERLIQQQPALASRGARFYAAAILSAMSHLHERDIVFRGLHPRAVLLDWAGFPRLADFSLAREVKHGQAYTLCGRLGYMAPEVLVGRGYDMMADFWSLGCLIFELVAGRPPFTHSAESTDPATALRRAAHADVCFSDEDSGSDSENEARPCSHNKRQSAAAVAAAAAAAASTVSADSSASAAVVPATATATQRRASRVHGTSACSSTSDDANANSTPSHADAHGGSSGPNGSVAAAGAPGVTVPEVGTDSLTSSSGSSSHSVGSNRSSHSSSSSSNSSESSTGSSAKTSAWRALVTSLLRPSPLERAGWNRGDLDVRDAPWLQDFAWEELLERRMQPPWVPSEQFLKGQLHEQLAQGWPASSDNGTSSSLWDR